MTTHYIQTLGVVKCRGILKGMPDGAQIFSLANNEYYRPNTNPFYPPEKPVWTRIWIDMDGHANSETRFLSPYMPVDISDLRAELSIHDTDSCTDILNHVSPNTVVVG